MRNHDDLLASGLAVIDRAFDLVRWDRQAFVFPCSAEATTLTRRAM